MIKVGVIGSTGYAGAELVKILSRHPEVEITALTSRQYAGIPFSDVYPFSKGIVGNICETFELERFCDKTDYVFTALPHKLPMEIVPSLLDKGKKIIDLSADFRFKDVKRYEKYYQPHSEPELLNQAVYGLSEIFEDKIKNASIIGNPGCYPTTVLLALIPLLKEGLVEKDDIISDSKSGVSGAGRSVSLGTHYCEVNETFKTYGLNGHRHRPEMEEVLSNETGTKIDITFIPHLIPVNRGMLSTIYTKIKPGITQKNILDCYKSYYDTRTFVRIFEDAMTPPEIKNVSHTNFCDIGFALDKNTNRLVLISAIDNLVKGASGQAIQNMNIMAGIDETTGLI